MTHSILFNYFDRLLKAADVGNRKHNHQHHHPTFANDFRDCRNTTPSHSPVQTLPAFGTREPQPVAWRCYERLMRCDWVRVDPSLRVGQTWPYLFEVSILGQSPYLQWGPTGVSCTMHILSRRVWPNWWHVHKSSLAAVTSPDYLEGGMDLWSWLMKKKKKKEKKKEKKYESCFSVLFHIQKISLSLGHLYCRLGLRCTDTRLYPILGVRFVRHLCKQQIFNN